MNYPDDLKQVLDLCQRERNIDKIVSSLDPKNKLVLFGAGGLGRYAFDELKRRKRTPDFFIDNDPDKWNEQIEGISVLKPDDLLRFKEPFDILISSSSVSEMVLQLEKLGLLKMIKGSFQFIFLIDIAKETNDRIRVGNDGRLFMPFAGMNIIGACNLRCDFCTTFSHLRTDFEPVDEILKSFERWKKKLNPELFYLSGGEPLLHPRISDIILTALDAWPTTTVELLTNGLLEKNLSDALLNDAGKTERLLVGITVHDRNTDIESIVRFQDRLKKHGIPFRLTDAKINWWKFYDIDSRGIPTTKHVDPRLAWKNCKCTNHRIQGDRLFACSHKYRWRRGIELGILGEEWKPALLDEGASCEDTPEEILAYIRNRFNEACSVCSIDREYIPPRQLSVDEVAEIKKHIRERRSHV